MLVAFYFILQFWKRLFKKVIKKDIEKKICNFLIFFFLCFSVNKFHMEVHKLVEYPNH
jgi:hypothetical protein